MDTPNINHPSEKFNVFVRAAMPVQQMLGNQLRQHQLKDRARFEGNPSIYRVLNEYRFFRTGLEETSRQREYQLQSIAYSKLLKDLLSFCDSGKYRGGDRQAYR
ncbi:hypothetical protein [Mucilaginibacter phyllosphaerae]